MVYKNASFNFPSHWKNSKKRGKDTTFFPTGNTFDVKSCSLLKKQVPVNQSPALAFVRYLV
jgi:hypothetical protein